MKQLADGVWQLNTFFLPNSSTPSSSATSWSTPAPGARARASSATSRVTPSPPTPSPTPTPTTRARATRSARRSASRSGSASSDADAAEDPDADRRAPARPLRSPSSSSASSPAPATRSTASSATATRSPASRSSRRPATPPGHVVFWRESDGVLVLGDVLNNMDVVTGIPGLRLPKDFLTPDPARNRESAKRLGPLEPKLVLFGHGAPLRDTQASSSTSAPRFSGLPTRPRRPPPAGRRTYCRSARAPVRSLPDSIRTPE